jgi:hypothetical protein
MLLFAAWLFSMMSAIFMDPSLSDWGAGLAL